MVGQVLIVAVQNGVERRQLGVAMATTSFFRGLGGAVGAAVLGAIFAARAGGGAAGVGGLSDIGPVARAEVIDGVQDVFIVAAPIAAVALALVLLLREVPLQGPAGPAGGERRAEGTSAATPPPAAPAASPSRGRVIPPSSSRGGDWALGSSPGHDTPARLARLGARQMCRTWHLDSERRSRRRG